MRNNSYSFLVQLLITVIIIGGLGFGLLLVAKFAFPGNGNEYVDPLRIEDSARMVLVGKVTTRVYDYIDPKTIDIEILDEELSKLEMLQYFVGKLRTVEYSDAQYQPNRIFIEGGNRQSMSVWLVEQLRANGVPVSYNTERGSKHLTVSSLSFIIDPLYAQIPALEENN